MPRDATETRIRLIAEAERLFAEQGIWRVRILSLIHISEPTRPY